jgi:hypothetical protein
MQLLGAANQQRRDILYDASSTIASGGTAQLVLAESKSRSFLLLQNLSDTIMFVQIGAALAHANLTSGVVTSVTIDNGGQGFTYPPDVQFLGGGPIKLDGRNVNTTVVSATQPGYDAPSNVATGVAVLAGFGGVVNSVTITNGGSGYITPPYVLITNPLRDPAGCLTPSATSGIALAIGNAGAAGSQLIFNGTNCPTGPVSIFCSATGKAFTVKWMT